MGIIKIRGGAGSSLMEMGRLMLLIFMNIREGGQLFVLRCWEVLL